MGLGAEVEVFRPGQKPLLRRAHTDGGYLGSSDPRLHFGLGKESAIAKVVVHWVGGESESWTGVPVDRILKVKEGTGKRWVK